MAWCGEAVQACERRLPVGRRLAFIWRWSLKRLALFRLLFVTGCLRGLRRSARRAVKLLGQLRAIARYHSRGERFGCLCLFKHGGQLLRRSVTQRRVLADGFQQINRICHVIPLFPLMVVQQFEEAGIARSSDVMGSSA